MRISIPIAKAGDDKTHWLSIEKNDDTATLYFDNDEIGTTDYINIDELITAIGLVWGNWERAKTEEKKAGA
jgi:hypothetical protein